MWLLFMVHHKYPDYIIIHKLARKFIKTSLDRHIVDYGDYLTVTLLTHKEHWKIHKWHKLNLPSPIKHKKKQKVKKVVCPAICPDNCLLICP